MKNFNSVNKKNLIVLVFITFFIMYSYGQKKNDINELKKFAGERIISMDETLKVPYYNLSINSEEISFQQRIKLGPIYIEPKAFYYPQSALNHRILRPWVYETVFPSGYGGEFGLLLKEAPMNLFERRETDSRNKSLLDEIAAGIQIAEQRYWHADYYFYIGKYFSDKIMGFDSYLNKVKTVTVIGMKRLNAQKIREVDFDNEKYYVTPGPSRTYDGFGTEIWLLEDMDMNYARIVTWSERKFYKEWELKWGLWMKLDAESFDYSKQIYIMKKSQFIFEFGISFIKETNFMRSSLRVGIGAMAYSREFDDGLTLINSNDAKLYPLLDLNLMF